MQPFFLLFWKLFRCPELCKYWEKKFPFYAMEKLFSKLVDTHYFKSLIFVQKFISDKTFNQFSDKILHFFKKSNFFYQIKQIFWSFGTLCGRVCCQFITCNSCTIFKWPWNGFKTDFVAKMSIIFFFLSLVAKNQGEVSCVSRFPLGNSMCRNWCSSAWLHSFKENEMQRDWNLASLWPQYICTYLIALPVQ